MESMNKNQIKARIAIIKKLSARNKRDSAIPGCLTRRINNINARIKSRATLKEKLHNDLRAFKDRLFEKTIAAPNPDDRVEAKEMLEFIRKSIHEVRAKYVVPEKKFAKVCIFGLFLL